MLDAPSIDLVLRALSDPTRRAVFERIARARETTVGDLTRGSDVTQGAISQHLKLLRQAGLVTQRPEGRNVYYRTRPEGLAPLADWLIDYDAFWRERFADLRSLLKEIDP
jgi:DNA-binding transcriptional ArsR family regulator